MTSFYFLFLSLKIITYGILEKEPEITPPLFSVSIVRPRWTVEPTDRQFAQGSDAKVDCKADGFPQPSISWKKAVGKSTDSSVYKRLVVCKKNLGEKN